MSVFAVGEVNRFPWITVTLTIGGRGHDVRFLVDTRFNGELALPLSYGSRFEKLAGSTDVLFANGQVEDRPVTECEIRFGDETLSAEILFINTVNPLLGVELLEGMRFTAEFEEGGEVLIEQM